MLSSNVLKILLVLDMLKRTDEQNPINSTQIIEKLEERGLKAERKSIGNYIKCLKEEMHYEIELHPNKNLGWYMIGQEFEDYELKMLADAVAQSQFLTADHSRKLIKKIKNIATIEGERIIKNTVVMDKSLKLVDGKFVLKFDIIMRAIADNRKVSFKYYEIGPHNKRVARKDGKIYTISPYYLGVWGHEYFVVANTDPYDNVSNYRVEMMGEITISNEKIKPMSKVNQLCDIGNNGRTFIDFIKESVNLKNGPVKNIRISGINHLRKEIVKKYGNDVTFRDQGEDRFVVNVNAADSRGFYEWIARYGSCLKIEGPQECIDTYKDYLLETLDLYE